MATRTPYSRRGPDWCRSGSILGRVGYRPFRRAEHGPGERRFPPGTNSRAPSYSGLPRGRPLVERPGLGARVDRCFPSEGNRGRGQRHPSSATRPRQHHSPILLTGGRTTVPRFDEVRRDLERHRTARERVGIASFSEQAISASDLADSGRDDGLGSHTVFSTRQPRTGPDIGGFP